MCTVSGGSRGGCYLGFSRVLVGLDQDLANADVLTHGPQRRFHGLSRPQDGNAGDLRTPGRAKDCYNVPAIYEAKSKQ